MERYEYIKRRLMGRKGAYLLFFELSGDVDEKIGVLGEIRLPKGVYVYIGSGLGPGGIWSRIKRHLFQANKKRHWHIDYLTTTNYFRPLKIIVIEDNEPLEEVIAEILLNSDHYSIAHPRFGSTDKRSPSHLFRVDTGKMGLAQVIDKTIERIENILRKPISVIDI